MAKLETAVQDLAVALEELSVRVERRMLSSTEQDESLTTVRNQARAVQKHAGAAALGLASAIDELKAMIERVEPAEGEQH